MLAQAQNDELDTGPRRTAPGAERFCAVTGFKTYIHIQYTTNHMPKRNISEFCLWVMSRCEEQLVLSRTVNIRMKYVQNII